MEKEIILDAKNKKLGRLASEAAYLLRGKGSVSYSPHSTKLTKVTVINVDQISITEKKLAEKEYSRYSGYPGGRHVTKAVTVVAKKDMRELLRRAVSGMLSSNRLKRRIIKNLIMYHGESK